jgi:SOS-response transcriptional repressor LexA
MEPWRKRLEQLIDESGLDMKAVSIKAGLNASYVRDALRRGRGGKIENLQKIAAALGVSFNYLLTGRDIPDQKNVVPVQGSVQPVPVRGQTAAGRWMEFDETSLTYADIPAVKTELGGQQFAFQVVGPSMDKRRIHDGDYVICVSFWGHVREPRTGDIVVVERKRGPTFERTVKELVVKPGQIELWPRSTDPRFQAPLVVSADEWTESDGTVVEMVGLVVAIHVPVAFG